MAKARVLAVDDQRYFRELIEGLLAEEGYDVLTASSGEEALHVLERESFDVVITDLVMPGIDGCQLVQRVKQRMPDQDIVMVTGVVDVKTAVEAMKLGATDYLLKPFDRKALARSLDQILQRRRMREEHARLMAENLEYMGVLSLYERAFTLASILSPAALAERMVEDLCLEIGAQGGVAWISQHDESRVLHLTGARGLVQPDGEPAELRPEELGRGFRELVQEGRSLIRPWDRGSVRGLALWVPVRWGGALLGLIRLTDKLEGAEFTDRDRAAADKYVELAAVLLSNAQRFRALERRSFRDPTTKAYTRAFFQDVVRNEIQKASRFGRHFSVVRIDVGAFAELRSQMVEHEVGRWLESLVHHASQALRSTDLLAAESETRYSVLLPETDALGATALKRRIREAVETSGLLDSCAESLRPELCFATATFPTDGTQLESLDRILDERIAGERESSVRELRLDDQPLESVLDALLRQAQPERPEVPGQIVRFAFQEIARRPRDRALLFVSPAGEPDVAEAVREGLESLRGARVATEIVLVGEGGDLAIAGPTVTCVSQGPGRAGVPFLVYYGEGPAYGMLTASKDGERRPFFHTSDRALVEHLAFQLQRDLAVPLSS